MEEFKYGLKILAASFAIVLAMQIKVSGGTVEEHTENWLRTSSAPMYLQKVADGAALAIRNAVHSISNYTNHALGANEGQRASRLGFDMHRSPEAVGGERNTKSPPEVDGDSEE
jgi:hypothetical protein